MAITNHKTFLMLLECNGLINHLDEEDKVLLAKLADLAGVAKSDLISVVNIWNNKCDILKSIFLPTTWTAPTHWM